MFWPLIKITLFVVAIGVISSGLALLLDLDGKVTFEIFDLAIQTDFTNFVILLLLCIPVLWGVYFLVGLCIAICKFFVGDETALSRYLNKSKTRKGFQALADSMIALASGEPAIAKRKINLAEKFLKRPDLTGLLAAQTAERMGDTEKAQEAYKQLLEDKTTRFVGVAGILKHSLSNNDTKTALKLAEKAHELNPKHEETINVLFKLQCQEKDWAGAEQTLKAKNEKKQFNRNEFRHHRAVLLLCQGEQDLENKNLKESKAKVYEANKLDQSLIQASLQATKFKLDDGDKKAASKILMQTWNQAPHPDIVKAFSQIEPDESLENRYNRFKKLIQKTLTHPESRMAMAELALSRKDYFQASRELETVHEDDPTVRSYLILAAIERGIGADEGKIQNLLGAALSANKGPVWNCTTCQQTLEAWFPVCSHCGDFNSVIWEKKKKEIQNPASSIKLLPLDRTNEEGALKNFEESENPDVIQTNSEIEQISN